MAQRVQQDPKRIKKVHNTDRPAAFSVMDMVWMLMTLCFAAGMASGSLLTVLVLWCSHAAEPCVKKKAVDLPETIFVTRAGKAYHLKRTCASCDGKSLEEKHLCQKCLLDQAKEVRKSHHA